MTDEGRTLTITLTEAQFTPLRVLADCEAEAPEIVAAGLIAAGALTCLASKYPGRLQEALAPILRAKGGARTK